jgi:Phycobilisome protein
MITLLEELVDRAAGSYAERQDLNKLEHLMSSWAERKEAYLNIQSKEDSIVELGMKLMQENPDFPAKAANEKTLISCRRDLTLALRYYALGMLLQDKEMLKDRFIYWQKNVLKAMGLHHYQGVKFVLEAIYIELPKSQADLLQPYFKLGQDTIDSN